MYAMLFLLVCCIVQFCFAKFGDAAGAGLQFTGKTDQQAEYEPWDFSTRNGTLSFLFQTHKRTGLLLYQDNKRNNRGNDYFDVFIVDGHLRLRFYITFCSGEPEELLIEGDFSDSQWYEVSLGLTDTSISFSVDKTAKSIMSTAKVIMCPNAGRYDHLRKRRWTAIYLGGIDLFSRGALPSIGRWASPSIFNEVGSNSFTFEGCIGNLLYRKGSGRGVKAKLRKKTFAVAECENACTDEPQTLKCNNDGLCIDHILSFECDCTGTGYEGIDCAKESSMVYMNKSGYIFYRMLSHPNIDWSMKSNRVSFRFVTFDRNGVIVYLGKAKDHLVVELVEGKLQISTDLGKGQFVMRSNTTFNISEYNYVEIIRRQRRLTLDINRGREVQSKLIPGKVFVSLDLKGAERTAYFGGGPGSLPLSTSQRNFSGFLQQLKFDKFKVLDKVVNNLFPDKRFGVCGKVENGANWRDLLPQDKSIVGSGCSELNDDEDNEGCRPTTPKCNTPECIFRTEPRNTDVSTKPSIATRPTKTDDSSPTPGVVMSLHEPPAPDHRTSPWIIIIIVAAAVVAVLITIFFLYRWNIRYSGSFKPSKSEPGEGVKPVERGYEQPAFYVSPQKPQKVAEETMA